MYNTVKFQWSTKLYSITLYKKLLTLIILIGIISLSYAINTNEVVIRSTGKISLEIMAKSGSAKDIQTAINDAVSLGIKIVRIPEGTFNFVEIGQEWFTVIIPAGISVFGAPTERYSNGSVKEWKTVLVMPYDVPTGAAWFEVHGNSDPNEPFRFSDIKLVGYRSINSSSTTKHWGLGIDKVINFRVDHCCFEHICYSAICVSGHYCCGVIDHCVFDNPVGTTGLMPEDSTVEYGILITRAYPEYETEWEPDLRNILGKYLNYTVFIEDCYFTKWRSAIAGNRGAFYVVRHCIFEHTLARGEVDAHPAWESVRPNVACRGFECYNNIFRNPAAHEGWDGAIECWAGGGVVFNNYVDNNYGNFIYMFGSGGWSEDFDPHYYIWNNTLGQDVNFFYGGSSGVENYNYFLYKPDWYTPYPYPHPLTIE
jgi:hypothetical protein